MSKETHAEVATRLVVKGCLPAVLGGKPMNPDTRGAPMREEDRAKLLQDPANQLNPDGKTYFFAIGKDGVFCDLSPERTTVWFQGADADKAMDLYEKELKRAYPAARVIDEREHPNNPNLSVRFHRIDAADGLSALVETTFPRRGGKTKQFVQRVVFLRTGHAPSGIQPEAITPASLTAFLAANTIVPMILGTLSLRTPAIGKPLSPEQRKELGLPPGGAAVVYELAEGDVLMDLAGNTGTISFAKGDVATAISTFDRLLKRDAPTFAQVEDIDHPRGGVKRVRVYQSQFEGGLVCRIEVDYPAPGATGMDNRFVVRVGAFTTQRMN